MSPSQIQHPRAGQPAGHRLFARYAHAPNRRGYCGPEAAVALEAVACGGGQGVDVGALARRFGGAWPYHELIAELAGISDPLDERVGRAYWTGSELTARIDSHALGELLIERFARGPGRYWAHLTDELLDEVTPTHAFHVLGVYPWSRLLASGRDEPVHVLDTCLIRPAEVLELRGDSVLVRSRSLVWDGHILLLGAPHQERVTWRLSRGSFTGELQRGDWVAVHWHHVCERLTARQAATLAYWTGRQLEITNRRLDPRRRRGRADRGLGSRVALSGVRSANECLLEADPELGTLVEPALHAAARDALTVPVVELAPRSRALGTLLESAPDALGLLILDGVVAVEVHVAERGTTELLGPGDIVAPGAPEAAQLIGHRHSLQALTPVRAALLDARFMKASRAWPQINAVLWQRAAARSLNQGIQRTIASHPRLDDRLTLVLVHLATRWGHVTPDGIRLELPLTHDLLARIVSAERPSVSRTMARLADLGLVHGGSGRWLLATELLTRTRELAPVTFAA